MRAQGLVVVATFCAGLVACVFFVPSPLETTGATCGLTKDESDTACGKCLVKSCQSALDACCASGALCEKAIPAVARCQDDNSTCADAGTADAETSLRTCARVSCLSDCGDGLPKEKDAAVAPPVVCRSGAGDDCYCEASEEAGASSGRCTSSSSGVTKQCCAEEGFPTTVGKLCVCRPRYCLDDGSGRCTCGYFGKADSKSKSSCSSSRGLCCKDATGTGCACDVTWTSCPSDMTEATLCTASELLCLIDANKVNTKKVSTCAE